jgi:hypothetical protein
LYELGCELLPHARFSSDLAPNVFFMFADLKRLLAGKKFSTNEEVDGIEKLYDRYNRCIALEGLEFYLTKYVLLC